MAPATVDDRPPKKSKSVSYKKTSLSGKTSSSLGPSSRKTYPDKWLKENASTRVKERLVKRNPERQDKVKAQRGGNTELPTSFKLVAGSYEKLLYGLDGQVTLDEEMKLHFHLLPIFIFPAHVSCIKAVAASPHGGKWLATGSADEIIKIWDLRRRKEVGGLMHHEGSITHLVFPSRSHLLSASEDGSLCLFHARDWTVLRTLRGHKGRVNAVAVHPSGKVALSVGKDKALRMWDLMRGKGVASTKLDQEGETVCWSIDGMKFAVQSGSVIHIYTTNMDLLYTITHGSRIHSVMFCSSTNKQTEVLLIGAEDRRVSVYQIRKNSKLPTVIAEMVGHTNRIKAVKTLEIALPKESGRISTIIACTVSSDGFINVYDIADIPEPTDEGTESPSKPKQIEPLSSYNSNGTRLTCLALADGDLETNFVESGKRKRDEREGEEDFETNWGGVSGEVEGQESEDEEIA